MITHENLGDFVTSLHRFVKQSHPIGRAEVERAVVCALQHSSHRALLQKLKEHGPQPVTPNLCKEIADYLLAKHGVVVPADMSLWPFPDLFTLDAQERKEAWESACQLAMALGQVDPSTLAFYPETPNIVPAGEQRWFLTYGSPMPASVCFQVFGAQRLRLRLADTNLYQKTPAQKEADAAYFVGLLAVSKRNYEEAFAAFQSAAGQGHHWATLQVAMMAEAGAGCIKDTSLAYDMYVRAAGFDLPLAHHNLGGVYLGGELGQKPDIDRAIEHFKHAAELGMAAAKSCLAEIYRKGVHVPPDHAYADALLEEALALGEGHALNVKAIEAEVENGVVTPETFAKYRRAARGARFSQDTTPLFNIARCYLMGNGVNQDLRKARRLFRIVGKRGDADAQVAVVEMLMGGHGTPSDHVTAVDWARKAAEQMHPRGLLRYGELLCFGTDVEHDERVGIACIFSAADLDNPLAMRRLATMYAYGELVEPDIGRALGYLEQARNGGADDPELAVALKAAQAEED